METKRFWKKVLIAFLIIVVCVSAIKLVANKLYEKQFERDEETLVEDYEIEKEKCELLRTIANDFIEEGKGINLQEIPDNIRYEIKNDNDGNIEFHYYIKPEYSSDANPYKAWITLSKDYKVIEEEYGIELEKFEAFKKQQEKVDWVQSYAFSTIIVSIAILFVICIVYIVIDIQKLKKKKSHSQEKEPIE